MMNKTQASSFNLILKGQRANASYQQKSLKEGNYEYQSKHNYYQRNNPNQQIHYIPSRSELAFDYDSDSKYQNTPVQIRKKDDLVRVQSSESRDERTMSSNQERRMQTLNIMKKQNKNQSHFGMTHNSNYSTQFNNMTQMKEPNDQFSSFLDDYHKSQTNTTQNNWKTNSLFTAYKKEEDSSNSYFNTTHTQGGFLVNQRLKKQALSNSQFTNQNSPIKIKDSPEKSVLSFSMSQIQNKEIPRLIQQILEKKQSLKKQVNSNQIFSNSFVRGGSTISETRDMQQRESKKQLNHSQQELLEDCIIQNEYYLQKPSTSSMIITENIKQRDEPQVLEQFSQIELDEMDHEFLRNKHLKTQETGFDMDQPTLKMASEIFETWFNDYKSKRERDIASVLIDENDEEKVLEEQERVQAIKKKKIPIDLIISNLLSIGLSQDEKLARYIVYCALNIHNHQPNLLHKNYQHISLQEFLEIFRGGNKLDKVLEKLNIEATYDQKQERERKKYFKMTQDCLNIMNEQKGTVCENTSEKHKQALHSTSPQRRSTIGMISELISNKLQQRNKGDQFKRYQQIIQVTLDQNGETFLDNFMSSNKFTKGFQMSKKKVAIYGDSNTKQNQGESKIEEDSDESLENQQSPTRLKIKRVNNTLRNQKISQEWYNKIGVVNKYFYEKERIKKQLIKVRKQIIYYEIWEDAKKVQALQKRVIKYDKVFNRTEQDLMERSKTHENLKAFVETLRQKYGDQVKTLLIKLCLNLEFDFSESDLYLSKPFIIMKKIISLVLQRLKKQQKQMKFPNEDLIGQYRVAESWWNQIDPLKLQSVKRNQVEVFFKNKQIISDEREVDTIFRSNLKCELEPNGMIKKSQFMGIFSKAIMRGSLQNIYNFMMTASEGTKSICTSELELSQKVLKLQRMILINGINAKNNIGILLKGKVQNEGLSQTCANIVENLQKIHTTGGYSYQETRKILDSDMKGIKEFNEKHIQTNQGGIVKKDKVVQKDDDEDERGSKEFNNSYEFAKEQNAIEEDDERKLLINSSFSDNDDLDQISLGSNQSDGDFADQTLTVAEAKKKHQKNIMLMPYVNPNEEKTKTPKPHKRISLIERQKMRMLMNKTFLIENRDRVSIENMEKVRDLLLSSDKMFKKIEKIITQPLITQKQQDLLSVRSQSTFQQRSSSFINTGSKNSVSPVRFSVNALPLDKIKMDFTLTATNSRTLGAPIAEETISSNLAYDGYQCLLGVGTQDGSLIVFSLKGQGKVTKITEIGGSKKAILNVRLVTNQPYMVAINISNDVFLINYYTQTWEKLDMPAEFDQSNESFIYLYTPDFLYGQADNDDFAFLGTDSANLYVLSISEKKFIYKIPNPFSKAKSRDPAWNDECQYQITDVKMNRVQLQKVIVSYKHLVNEESAVSVFSFGKNKEIQQLYFQPSAHTELGQAIAVDFSPDNTQLVVTFSSGKIQVFKQQQKLEFGLIRPLYSLELNNNSLISSASMRWRELGDGRQCLLVFYQGSSTMSTVTKKVQQVEKELALFIGGNTKLPLSKSYFINTLPNVDDQIKDCLYSDFMINEQTETISHLIGDLIQTEKTDRELKLRQQRLTNLSANLIIVLSENNKIYYYNSDKIGIEQNVQEEQDFKLIPTILQTPSLKDVAQYRIQQFVSVDMETDKQFIQFIEDFGFIQRQNKLFEISKYDDHFQTLINRRRNQNRRNRSASRNRNNRSRGEKDLEQQRVIDTFYASNTEVESFFMANKQYQNSSNKNSQVNSLILGYIFGVSETQTLTIARVETQKIVTIFQNSNLAVDFGDTICALEVSKQYKMVILSVDSGCTYFLDKSQQIIKNQYREIEYFKLRLTQFQYLEAEPYQSVSTMQVISHSTNQESLLIQGYQNGRIKIYNINKQKVIFNIQNLTEQHAITQIEKQRIFNKDQSSILCGSANGTIIQILVKEKEAILSKSKQVDNCAIIQIQNNLQSNKASPSLPSDHFFVLTEKSLYSLDRLSLTVKNKYDIPVERDSDTFVGISNSDKFSLMLHTKMGDSSDNQYAVACFLEKTKWLLLFEPLGQVCYGVKDLSSISVSISKIYATSQRGVFLLMSLNNQCWIFTFRRKRLEFGLSEKLKTTFSYSWANKVQVKPIKRGFISSIFSSNINLFEQMKKNQEIKYQRRRSQSFKFEEEKSKQAKLTKQSSSSSIFRSVSFKSKHDDSVLLQRSSTRRNEVREQLVEVDLNRRQKSLRNKKEHSSGSDSSSSSELDEKEKEDLYDANFFNIDQRLLTSNSVVRLNQGQGEQGKQILEQKSRINERKQFKSIGANKRPSVTAKRRLSLFQQQ